MRIAQMNIAEAFRIFGFDHAVTREEVKTAYKNLMRRFHPDANPGLYEGDVAKDALLRIQDAYECLMQYFEATVPPEAADPAEPASPKVFGSKSDLTEMQQRRKNKAAHVRQEQRAAVRAAEEKKQKEAMERQHRQTKAYEEAMTKIHTQRAAELTAQIIEAYLRNGENLAGE